ncbi:MAG: DUF5668 domain-containing protein [Acidobacteriaceae bacterium]
MNTYVFLHRIKGPVIILVFGVTALLDQWHVLSYSESWPLYLIAIGLLQLAERAAWSQMHAGMPSAGFPGGPYQGSRQGSYQGGSGQTGNWGAPSAPSSPALSIAPPDLPRGLKDDEREGR